MSAQLSHRQIEELLGAFALDAVDGDEWEAIDLHLRDCPRCRAEVAEHREVAALLAHTGAPAPDGVWSRILAELEPAAPALRMPEMPTPLGPEPVPEPQPGPRAVSSVAVPEDVPASDAAASDLPPGVIGFPSRQSTVRTRTLAAVVAAAAVIVALLGIVTVRQNQHLDRLDASLRDVSVERVASRAMSDPQATTAKLSSDDGRVNAAVVLDAKGKGYLLASKLPELPKDQTYQLWGQAGSSVVSLGVFDGATDVVPFQVGTELRDDLNQLMVTEEASPGVLETKQQPLLSGEV